MKKCLLIIVIASTVVACAYAGLWDSVKSGASFLLNKVIGKKDAYTMPEEDFKKVCEEISYSDMMKEVEENMNKFVFVEVGIRQNITTTDFLAHPVSYLYGIPMGVDGNSPLYLVDALKRNPTLNSGFNFKIWGIYKGLQDVYFLSGLSKIPKIEVVYSQIN